MKILCEQSFEPLRLRAGWWRQHVGLFDRKLRQLVHLLTTSLVCQMDEGTKQWADDLT